MLSLEPLDSIFARARVTDETLRQARGASRDQTIARLAPVLAKARAFPEGFWHPEDIESALEVMGERLVELGVEREVIPEAQLARLMEEHADDLEEDALRRRQIGMTLQAANASLSRRGEPARFYAFAEDVPGYESDEPVWLLLTADERARLLGLDVLEEPSGLEASFNP